MSELITQDEVTTHPPHRQHESPLTFLRSRANGPRRASDPTAAAGSLGTNLAGVAVPTVGALDYVRASIACLSAAYGEKQRSRVYGKNEADLEAHEMLDTLAVRRLQTAFTWQAPVEDSEATTGGTTGAATARYSFKPSTHKSYVLKAKDDVVTVAMLTHVVERITTAVPFLGDPTNCWASDPREMSILLTSHVSRLTTPGSTDPDLPQARRICLRSSPIDLRLARLVWRRNGTLWAQWRVVRGNLDRLRADLRIISGGVNNGGFCQFQIETLVLAVVHKPSSADFRIARTLTERLSAEFSGTPFLAKNVYRLRAEICALDRTGEVDVLPLMRSFPVTEGDVNRVLWGFQVLRASPSVRRIIGTLGASLLGFWWFLRFGNAESGRSKAVVALASSN